ncbi:winged helix-turn-helix transcriptional regulator [Qipengyuania sp.]|uniref:winged helix-turn-helix transcriptional regulator n=1 Tax=Qipengyuania sp. TaxID=2004515 RepID=UPI0035C831E0
MELIGERWSLMILRELMLGPRRFTDLRASLPGLSAKILTERLASLEAVGALTREELPPPAASKVYALTRWAYAAEPAIQELGRWAAMHSGHDPTLPLSPVSLMLSLRTMFDPAKAAGLRATIGFDVRGEQFVADMADGALPIRRGDAREGQAVLRAPDAPVLAALFYADVPAATLERDAGLVIEGDRDLAMRFASIFELPEKLA